MSQTDNAKPYLSADFGEQGGRFDWQTPDEALTWINQLREQWSWLANQGHNATQQTWQSIANGFNNPVQNIQQAQNYQNQGQQGNAENQIAAARSSLESFIKSRPWLLSHSAQRQFVEEMRDAGKPLEAALIVANWMGQDLGGAPVQKVVAALLQWELYERGINIKDRMKTESATLKRLAGDMQTTLTKYQEAERTQSAQFENLHSQFSEQATAQKNTFDSTQQDHDAEWRQQIEETQAELTRLKDTYDKYMALAAPVEYWEKKRKKHGIWTFVSFAAIVVCMVVVGIFLHTELQSVGKAVEANRVATLVATTKLPESLKEPKQMSAESSTQTVATLNGRDQRAFSMNQSFVESATTWRLGSFILLATLSFWFIRILVRIFLSNLHLENDSAERVTMAKTYLALIRDGALPKGESINTVLAALFRPTGDGIVKDEGLPPTAMEWMTKLGGK